MANANQKRGLYEFNVNGTMATFTFANDAPIAMDTGTLSAAIVHNLIMHGLKQKVADGAAMSRNPETGRPATDADKVARMRAIADRLMAGHWRAEGGEGGVRGGLLYRALCELYPSKTPEEIRAYLDARTDAEQAALRKTSRIAPIIERLRAESAKANGIDGDALLEGLGGPNTHDFS